MSSTFPSHDLSNLVPRALSLYPLRSKRAWNEIAISFNLVPGIFGFGNPRWIVNDHGKLVTGCFLIQPHSFPGSLVRP